MQVVIDYPPNIDAIDAVFHVRDKPGVIYTYGDIIYNPSRIVVTPSLYVHEEVHSSRQLQDVEGWWSRYLVDVEFRLAEELPAHIAEYREACKQCKDRNVRMRNLMAIALRLSGPLYGNILTLDKARAFIEKAR